MQHELDYHFHQWPRELHGASSKQPVPQVDPVVDLVRGLELAGRLNSSVSHQSRLPPGVPRCLPLQYSLGWYSKAPGFVEWAVPVNPGRRTADCYSQAHSALAFAEWAAGPQRFVRPLVSDLEGVDSQAAVAWAMSQKLPRRVVRSLLKGVAMMLDLGLVDRGFLDRGHSADRLAPRLVVAATVLTDR